MIEEWDQVYAEALAFEQAGYWEDAEAKYQQILSSNQRNVEAWQGLGRVYFAQQNYDQALNALEQALRLDETQAVHYYYLGLIWEKVGDLTAAVEAYQSALDLDSEWVEVYLQFGSVWMELGEFEQAEFYYQSAIALEPDQLQAYLQLGNLYLGQNQLQKALDIAQIALQSYPQNSDLLEQFGLILTANQQPEEGTLYFAGAAYFKKDYKTAIQFYQKSLQASILNPEIYLSLGDCYQQINQLEAAIKIYQEALDLFPDTVELYLALISAWQNLGETKTAASIAEQAISQFPNHLGLKFAKQRLLPIIYDTASEIELYRQRFSQELDQLTLNTNLEQLDNRWQALNGVGESTNFYLQYQGYNDLNLQQQYGQFVTRIMEANYPEFSNHQVFPVRRHPKVKVGYISRYLNWHTVGILFLGWLRDADHQQFEIYCYFTGDDPDEVTHLFKLYSDQFYQIHGNLEEIIDTIRADELDILVFLDIGMCPQMTQLAGLRLVPVQCAAWGHPITTGLPTIDYFISATLLEPPDAQNYYSEPLICLPNLGINYVKPVLPELRKTRTDFGLKEDAVIYLSCQSLFKYLPQYDYLFAVIAQKITNSQLVFFASENPAITEKFKRRLHQKFAEFNLDFEEHCLILPRLDKVDYLQLNMLADIGLDTIQFTGFLTSLDSIACNLPLVTVRGQWMRSRQSAGILQRLGVTETIAQNEDEYLNITIELGLNAEKRQAIAEKIKQNQFILYQDIITLKALESFYLSVIHRPVNDLISNSESVDKSSKG